MSTSQATPIRDLEDARLAYERVRPEIEAQDPRNLSAINVDTNSAASVALGVAPHVLTLRDLAAQLPGFEVRCIDNLEDYAKAVWFLGVTNLPTGSPTDVGKMVEEVLALRGKFMLWGEPLAACGKFSRASLDMIKEGGGFKDAAGDTVAFVAMYRSAWDEVRSMCGVTEEDLDRAAEVGPALFATLSRRDNELPTPTESGLRLRQAWTLLDRAYGQCQRAVSYLRWNDGDADTYAPSLRRNSGTRKPSEHASTPANAATPAATPPSPAPAPVAAAATSPSIGTGESPFVKA